MKLTKNIYAPQGLFRSRMCFLPHPTIQAHHKREADPRFRNQRDQTIRVAIWVPPPVALKITHIRFIICVDLYAAAKKVMEGKTIVFLCICESYKQCHRFLLRHHLTQTNYGHQGY